MYDPKFEKGVRQKMEGLEFAPPDTVWANIEKAVAGRRRRPGFYLWRFALPGLLLAGAVSVVFLTGTPVNTDATASHIVTPNTKAVTPATAPATSAAPANANPDIASQANANPTNANPDIASPANTSAANASQAKANPTNANPTNANPDNADIATANLATPLAASSATEKAATRSPEAMRITHGNAQPQIENSATRQRFNTTAYQATGSKTGNANKNNIKNTTNNTNAADETSTPDANANNATALIAPYLYQPVLIGQGSSATIEAASVSGKKTLIALNTLQKKKRPWEAGFTAGGGISRLNRLNVSPSNSTLSASLYNITTASYSVAAAPSKTYVSDIKPDASFEGGIYLQKPLSDRWTLNLGMNLHYYSTRITIGEPVNTYVPVSASLVSPTVTANAQSSTAFIAGDRQNFTNHYYFLELPVNMQYTLKKSRMMPIFLQGGFSLSRLVGADALFYNTHSGVYYKDPNVLQKTQVNVASALMVGLPFHGIRIDLGPQIQYGLTPLINNHNQGDQHFLYTGLRVVVIPGKR